MRDKAGYLSQDTIAAISTALGGAISLVRVSGPTAFSAFTALASPLAAFSPPRMLVRTRLKGARGPIDDALSVRFVAPDSFTGEDVVEFHLHGSPLIASLLMEALAEQGVRQALPGEFSFRAVRNGKMDVPQAQALADLISSQNENAVTLALEKMSGTQRRLIGALGENLRQLATLSEVGIDFSDQNVEEVSLPRLKENLTPIALALKDLLHGYSRGSRIQSGVGVSFVGLPNSGKSSFFNALLGEDRSIVSDVAGTTRDIVREHLTLRGKNGMITLRMEDTAGLRKTDDHVEKIGIEKTRRSAGDAELILFLLDCSGSVAEAHEQWLALGRPSGRAIGILTKCDLASVDQLSQTKEALASFKIHPWVETSSLTGAGISGAIDAILKHCENWNHVGKGEILLTRLDQAQAVSAAVEHLTRAALAPELDLFASDLRHALHSLGALIGETPSDEVLGRIFSSFCIGK